MRQPTPPSSAAYDGLGLAYERLGGFEAATTAYEQVLVIDPDHRRAQRKLEGFSASGVMEIGQPLWRDLGERIALLACAVQRRRVRAGETVGITLWWEAMADIDRDYTVFVHVVHPDGRILVQEDALLLRGGRGTSDWPAWRIARK